MSTLNVDKVDPSTGTALEIGSSGDTITVPSGATLDISASTLTPPATMPASSGANLTALAAGNISTGTLAEARGGTGTTSYSPGITNAQTFRLTTSFTDSADPIASNWEEVDTDGYGQLGSNVSQSSGVFSFSATGIYLIIWNHVATLDGDDRQVYSSINTTTDNSSYDVAAEVREFIQQTSSSSAMCTGGCFHQLDVTNTTNVKVRFQVGVLNSSTQTMGNSGYTRTGVQFIRLGDT